MSNAIQVSKHQVNPHNVCFSISGSPILRNLQTLTETIKYKHFQNLNMMNVHIIYKLHRLTHFMNLRYTPQDQVSKQVWDSCLYMQNVEHSACLYMFIHWDFYVIY